MKLSDVQRSSHSLLLKQEAWRLEVFRKSSPARWRRKNLRARSKSRSVLPGQTRANGAVIHGHFIVLSLPYAAATRSNRLVVVIHDGLLDFAGCKNDVVRSARTGPAGLRASPAAPLILVLYVLRERSSRAFGLFLQGGGSITGVPI